LLNLEQPFPKDVVQMFVKAAADAGERGISPYDEDAWIAAAKAALDGKPGKEVYRAFKHGLDEFVTVDDAGEALDRINQSLRELGYDGLAHTGGAVRGGAPHNVSIIFDPAKVQIVGSRRLEAAARAAESTPPSPPAPPRQPPVNTAPPAGMPPRPPAPPTGMGGGDDVVKAIDGIIPGETVSDAAMRQYGGGVRAVGLEAQQQAARGTKVMAERGLKPGERTRETEALFRSLHDEGDVPRGLEDIAADIKGLVAQETKDTLDFDPKFALHPAYFPRFWKAPVETRAGPGRVGTTPGFKKARVDATFSELLDEGWEPATWNPYNMVAIRRIAGAQYREQQKLIAKLKSSEVAVPVDGPIPDGWSIPKVGPAFEGRPFANTEGKIGYTKPVMVPNNVADVLENMFGDSVQWRVHGVDLYKPLREASNAAKRVKLLGSLFQQMDFAARSSGSAFAAAIDDVLAGKPISAVGQAIKLPRTLGRLALANISGARRDLIQSQLLDTAPLVADRPGVNMRAILDQGLSTRDPSVFVKDLKDTVASEIDNYRGVLGRPRQMINQINKSMEDGLFEGVYPQAQLEAVRNFIVPSLARSHPDWTDAQIAAGVAREANKLFSSMPLEQSGMRHLNKDLAALTRMVVFSTNEPEALIKQAFSTVTGPNKKMWAEYFAGSALFLAATANAVHFLVTGEPLPSDRYSPIKKGGEIGVTYNPNLFSPDVPIKGRSGANLKLDLVMQMDTALRLLDPAAFARARENVIPRAIETQVTGKDFFGRPLEGVGERAAQAAVDVLPIPVQNLASIFRDSYGAGKVLPEGETRLGTSGLAAQLTGANLRAETNPDLRNRIAQEKYQRDWGQLTKTEQQGLITDTEAGEELARRRATSIDQGQNKPGVQFGEVKEKYDAIDAESVSHWRAGTLDKPLPQKWAEAGIGRRAENDRVEAIFEGQLKDIPQDRIRTVTQPYYDKLVKDTDTGAIDWDATYAAREDYIAGLSADKRGKAPSDREIMTDYLKYVEGSKTPERQEYDRYVANKKAAGYFKEGADRKKLDALNTDVDVGTWLWYGGVKGGNASNLNSAAAVDKALAANLPNRPVELDGLPRPITETAGTRAAFKEKGANGRTFGERAQDYIDGYTQDAKKNQWRAEQRQVLAREDHSKPYAQLEDYQKERIESRLTTRLRNSALDSSPDLEAYLAWMGQRGTITDNDQTILVLRRLRTQYGREPVSSDGPIRYR
jgi:hypothetical protein